MFSFDFNENPVKLYGIWPQTPFPVEVSIYGVCSNQCFYCFSNLNRAAAGRKPHEKNPIEKVISGMERAMSDPKDPVGYFLRNKYPVCFSNTTDPFMREEKIYRCTEAFLKYAKKRGLPLWIQTKGSVLAEEFDRYADLIVPGKDAVYITLTTLDDDVSRKIEPGAPISSVRLELIRKLSDRGIPVVVACNPYLGDWAGDADAYCVAVKAAGARGVWLEQLHFSSRQAEALPEGYKPYAMAANRSPMYVIGELKAWYKATAAAGVDFFPTPFWDDYFGSRAQHAECADPEWFGAGAHLFTVNFDFLRSLRETAYHGEASYDDEMAPTSGERSKLVFSWRAVERFMTDRGIKNPVLRTDPFWVPFNAKQVADHREFKARLGKEAPLYEILRYFYNHPYDSQNFLWYAPLVQAVYDFNQNVYVANNQDDLVGVYDPHNRHNIAEYYDAMTYQKHADEFVRY